MAESYDWRRRESNPNSWLGDVRGFHGCSAVTFVTIAIPVHNKADTTDEGRHMNSKI